MIHTNLIRAAVILCLTAFVSCDSNKKLHQENAEKVIREYLPNQSSRHLTFTSNPISSIESVNQFSDNEATTIAHLNKQPSECVDDNRTGTTTTLDVKITFKRNVDGKWIMTKIEGIHYPDACNHLGNWFGERKELNIPVQ